MLTNEFKGLKLSRLGFGTMRPPASAVRNAPKSVCRVLMSRRQ